jgi:pyruvate/2-oxoglutarate dehydrogenase complex dihydrolipoamide acyltransferase (E2) component
MVKDYLTTLKNAGDFSWAEISNISGYPDSTIRKIFSGETADPRFETVAKIVLGMGGNLDDAISSSKKKEIEVSSTISLKESCDQRLADQREYIDSLKRDKKMLGVAVAVLTSIIIITLAICVAF